VRRPFDKFGKPDFRRIALVVVTPGEHLPHVPEAVVTLQNRTQQVHSVLHHLRSKRFQILHQKRHVLHRVIAVFFDIRSHVRFFSPVDSRYQRDPEFPKIDAPQHHAGFLAGIGIILA